MSVVVISSSVVMTTPPWGAVEGKPYISIIEFDVPRCSLEYGVAPCEAELGVTGTRKCFNTRATCQDIPNFTSELVTLRFQPPTHQLHRDSGADVIPSVKVVRTTPQLIAPGANLGQRESVTIQFTDHLHSDAGFDPYLDERGYQTFNRGTFWGRFRARNPNLQGLPLRVSRGQLGQALSDYETWHYVIESATLSRDTFTIVGKDHLKFLDGDRAQAPTMSQGVLDAGIDDNDGSLTLSPAGIGDAEYPASGKLALGGKEIVSFTRTGDACNITRAQSNTEAVAHEEGDRVQLVLEYDSDAVHEILYDLITEYTDADPSWIDFDAWESEGQTISPLYSAEIAEPTSVRALVNELIEQTGLVMWWDSMEMEIRMQALRPVAPGSQIIDEGVIVQQSLSVTEQPNKKVTEAWTYFSRRNPLERLDEPNNYTSVAVSVAPDVDPNDLPAIKKVFSRWIPQGALTAAQRVNSLLITRYARPPRMLKFDIFRNTEPIELASRGRIKHWSIQDDTGAASIVPAQIVAVEPQIDRVTVQAEEQSFSTAPDDGEGAIKQIIIDADAFNINLREMYDILYQPPQVGDTVRFTILADVEIGSMLSSIYEVQGNVPWWWTKFWTSEPDPAAIDVGDWPDGLTLELIVNGRVQGIGGFGGGWNGWNGTNFGGGTPRPGMQGGVAVRTRYAIAIENNGEIYGGGGGGGAGDDFSDPVTADDYGGGGAGYLNTPVFVAPGFYGGDGAAASSATYNRGTTEAGGAAGGPGAGAGGGPGQDGANGSQGDGGVAGSAIDGDSFVTLTGSGTLLGPQVN